MTTKTSNGGHTKQPSAQITSIEELAELLRETAKHHDQFEKTHAEHHWSSWYAAYMNSRQGGSSSEGAAAAADSYMENVLHIAPR